jgi:uncharacterized protein YuzE
MEKLKIWYDPEGDFLEVSVTDREGDYRPSSSDNVILKVDKKGALIGFAILNISQVDESPLEVNISLKQLRKMFGLPALADIG